MRYTWILLMILILVHFSNASAQDQFESDTIKTDKGDLVITFIGHGTLMFTFNDMVIHIDPVGRYADYSKMPKANIILVTHHHGDHLDVDVINQIVKDNTDLVLTETCAQKIESGIVMKNGDVKVIKDLKVEAVPAYNLVHKRDNGEPFHPKGIGNGYVITLGDKKVYIAGDTENVPKMKQLAPIDIAFLPMNLPYTMTPVMVADAVQMIRPKILYPYHFGNTKTDELLALLKNKKDLDICLRKMN